MKNRILVLCSISLASSLVQAEPACKATVELRGDSGKKKTVGLQIKEPTANPVLMFAELSGVSFAAWFHKDTGTFDISMTPDSVQGTYARGLQAGPGGIFIIHDSSPNFVATLDCNR
jgi:hypothetical protein